MGNTWEIHVFFGNLKYIDFSERYMGNTLKIGFNNGISMYFPCISHVFDLFLGFYKSIKSIIFI